MTVVGGVLPPSATSEPSSETASTDSAATDRPIQVPENGYVGSPACRSCHPHNHATWHASYHRTMTQLATPESVVGRFDNVQLQQGGQTYRLDRRGDEFWFSTEGSGPLPQEGRTPAVRNRIVLTTGSHHMQIYWYPTGKSRVLEQLPFVYLIEEQRWIPRNAELLIAPGLFLPLRETGSWNVVCSGCHSTNPRPRAEGWEDMDTRVAEFGIACEACHGPGERHVQVRSDPLSERVEAPPGKADPTIVQPERLAPRLASQVCGQCHFASETYGPQQLQHLRQLRERGSIEDAEPWLERDLQELSRRLQEGPQYRPGEDLMKSRKIARGGPNKFWPDGMVRVSGREYNGLINTPCYTHGDDQRGVLSCLSCHSMHREEDDPRPLSEWTDDQLKPGMRTNEACVQCHPEYSGRARVEAHTHHREASNGSLCYNCHMPYTTYGLLKAIRSHTIDSPSVAVSLQTHRPNACNQCHLNRTLAWTADHLAAWYGIAKPELDEDERSIAASVLWLLRGDAGQRVLMAWSMGWDSARQVSGSDWMVPYLAHLMIDPYDAIRLIAYRSLRKTPEYGGFEYDFMASPLDRHRAVNRLYKAWFSGASREGQARTTNPAVLIDEQGNLNRNVFRRLHEQRDNRPVYLAE